MLSDGVCVEVVGVRRFAEHQGETLRVRVVVVVFRE